MANIGDIYYAFRGDGTKLQADAKKEGEKAAAAGSQSFASRWKTNLSKAFSGTKGGILAGLGLGVGFGAAQEAISRLTDLLGDSISAALQEQKSIQKLGTSLKANIPNWDGNTDAIERVLKARMKLGFSDDEQRDSLALLVAATHDANKALEVQRTAMDLARLKGISLKEASEALVKVEGGQYRMLKSLGIQLPKNATAEQALAEVQKVAFGQAEDYANTTAGKLEVAQVKVGEAMEKFGTAILPIVADALGGVADAADNLGTILEVLNEGLPKTDEGAGDLTVSLLDLAAAFNPAAAAARDAAKEMADAIETTKHHGDELIGVRSNILTTGDAYGALADDASESATSVFKSNEKMIGSVEDLEQTYVDALQTLIAQYFDPIQQKERLTADIAERAAVRKELAEKKLTTTQRRELKARLTDLDRNILETRVKLLEAGQLNAKQQAALLKELESKLTKSKGKARAAIQAIIDKVKQLRGLTGTGITVTVKSYTNGPGKQGRASGGPVVAGQPYIVGEQRPELFVPETNGYVYPTVAAGRAATGGDSGVTVQLSTYGTPMYAPTPVEVGRQVRRAIKAGRPTPPPRRTSWSMR